MCLSYQVFVSYYRNNIFFIIENSGIKIQVEIENIQMPFKNYSAYIYEDLYIILCIIIWWFFINNQILFEELKSLILSALEIISVLWLSVSFDADYLKFNQKLNQSSDFGAFFLFAAYTCTLPACIPPIVLEEVWDADKTSPSLGDPELKYFSLSGRRSLPKAVLSWSFLQAFLSFTPKHLYMCKAFIHVRGRRSTMSEACLSASFILGIPIAPHGYLAIAGL